MRDLRVTLIQADITWEDKKANLAHFDALIGSIGEPTDLILLPETFNTGFSINPAVCAEEMMGPSMQFLREKAAEKNAVVMATLIIREGADCFNRMICYYPDGTFKTYDKRHLFRLSNEYLVFKKGTGRPLFEVNGWKISPQTCYDLRFPAWYRNTCVEGIYGYDVLINLANWPAVRGYVWKALLPARALENQAYAIGVNRVGTDGGQTWHSGDSMALDAKGQVIYAAEPGLESVKTVTLSAAELENFRKAHTIGLDWDPFTFNPE